MKGAAEVFEARKRVPSKRSKALAHDMKRGATKVLESYVESLSEEWKKGPLGLPPVTDEMRDVPRT